MVTDTPQFKRWFSGSKVIAGGKPLMVFHGTNAKFDRFDLKRASKTDIRGIFFTVREKFASVFGASRIIAAYVRLLNPATFQDVIRIAQTGVPVAKMHTALIKAGYDGLYDKGKSIVIAFKSNQVKSVDNIGTFNPRSPNIFEGNSMGPFEKQIEANYTGLDEATAKVSRFPDEGKKRTFVRLAKQSGLKVTDNGDSVTVSGNKQRVMDVTRSSQHSGMKVD